MQKISSKIFNYLQSVGEIRMIKSIQVLKLQHLSLSSSRRIPSRDTAPVNEGSIQENPYDPGVGRHREDDDST